MEGVLNFLLIWILFIVISLILILKKSEKQLLDELKSSRGGLTLLVVLMISVLSGFLPSPLQKTDVLVSPDPKVSGCNQSGAKSFAVNRIDTTIGKTQFLDLQKDNGDSQLFYGSVYSSQYNRDVTVFILIGCSGGSYSVLNVDVQL